MIIKELPRRKGTRMQGFDYNSEGIYFITICTNGRQCILSEVSTTGVGTGVLDCPNHHSSVKLTWLGKVAEKYIKQLDDFYDNISVEDYVIMPNHIHMLLVIKSYKFNGQSRTPVPTKCQNANTIYSKFISTFKRFCNKEIGENIWQSRSNDHIIRNFDDYQRHLNYIYENPMKWENDELHK